MWCDGSCMRAFHCGVEKTAQEDSMTDCDDSADEAKVSHSQSQLQPFHCNPLSMPLDLYQRLKDTKDTFHCPNCLTGVHQCFFCKQEGVVEAHAADPANAPFANSVVFRCGVAACGRFYHADCMKSQADMKRGFLCPLHTCRKCGKDQSEMKGELVPCRRCPKAFHEHCMPSSLLELPDDRKRENWKRRIWMTQFEDGKCVGEVERSLIYCMLHKIASACATPDHARPVFHPILLQRWKEHFASAFPFLASSKIVQQQAENEDVPLAVRRRRSSEDEPASSALPLPRPGTHLAKPPRPQTSAKSAGQNPAAANKSATAWQAPGKRAAAADANSKQTAAQQDIAGKQGAMQRQDQPVAAKQGSAKQDTGKVVSTQQGLVLQHAGKQVIARQGMVTSGKSLPASLPFTTAASKSQGSASSASLSAVPSSARTGAARLDAPAVSSSTQAQAVPAMKEPMGPPPARKRPLLPDRSTLPPKKRRATAAAPAVAAAATGKVKQPDTSPLPLPARASAAGPAAASTPAVAAQSKPSGKQVQTVSKAGMAAGQPVSAPAGLQSTHAVKQQAATMPVAAEAAAAAPSSSTSAGKPAASSSPSAASPACSAEPQPLSDQSSPVQIVQQEDTGDVDIGDDFPPAPDVDIGDEAEASASAAARAAHEAGRAGAAGGAVTGAEAAATSAQAGTTAEKARVGHAAGTVQADADAAAIDAAPPPSPPRVWDLTTAYARQLKSMSLVERKKEAAKRVQSLINAHKGSVTLDMVKKNTRQPEPYSHPSKTSVTEERLQVAEVAVANARANPSRASIFVDKTIALEMLMHEDNLTMVLAPYLHGNRYSSYGRHFTKLHLLEQVAQLLSFYLHDGDTVVDFSCGANAFVPLVKQEGRKQGLSLMGKAYDIITSQNMEDFERTSWLDTRPGMLPPGQHLVIGLNPPFGKNNALARKFVMHAARAHSPRVIVLIVPPDTPIPEGYIVMYEDQTTMAGRGFFVPGAKGHDSWNKVTPALRVLVRAEWLNWSPPNGTGWFAASAPRLGTCRQSVRPPPFMPQHHTSWHQLPQHMPQQQHVPLHHMQQQMQLQQQQMQQQQMQQQQMHQQQMHQQQLAWPQQAAGVLPHMSQNTNMAYVPPHMRPPGCW